MKTSNRFGCGACKGTVARRVGLRFGTGFVQDQSGTLTVFGMMLLVLMLLMGGIAVDVMRYEVRRTSLQNTLDRSTLAAASLTQARTPAEVVNDYFRKAGVLSYLKSVTVTQGLNFRDVNAKAQADTNPIFMNMMDISSLDAFGNSTAEQRINNVEIMMVLDVSGSMGANNKLVNLKTAANAFVSTVLKNDAAHKISIGIVPFNGQINVGPSLRTYFNMTDLNGLPPIAPVVQPGVNCADLPASVYASYAIPQTTALSMTSNVDTYSSSSTTAPNEANKWCPAGNATNGYYTGNPLGSGGNQVRLPQQDIATLQGYINGLAAVGATSINAGMKWGMTLLDPSVQNIYNATMVAGKMPATMAGRPYAYTDKDMLKVIILMTDGENFAEDRVNSAYKTGASPIWLATDARWSIFHASKVVLTNASTICNSRPFWVPHLSQWHSRPWNGVAPLNTDCYVPSPIVPYVNTTNETWPQVWGALRMQYVVQNFYVNAIGGSLATQMNVFRAQTPTTTMDTQMQTACTSAKNKGVIIYGIAFEAPTNGQTQILACSTSNAHYFDAAGIQITSAFAAIANNISQLRLTQ